MKLYRVHTIVEEYDCCKDVTFCWFRCGSGEPRPEGPAHDGGRRDPPGLPATRRRSSASDLAACRRSAAPSLAQAQPR
jgi:hypothetical protein